MSALETIQGLLSPDAMPPMHGEQVQIEQVAVTSLAPIPTKTNDVVPSATSTKPSAANSVVVPRSFVLLVVLVLGTHVL